MQREDDDNDRDRPTVTITRDALLGLIDQTSAATPRAHTVSREQLRSRGTRNDLSRARASAADEPVEPDDKASALPPLLVLAVITVLLVAFIASTQLR